MNTPNDETRDMQVFLNKSGYKNADGTPLKIDGIHGPNTDNAINKFENDFLGQVVPNYKPKAIQTTAFPKVPNLSKVSTTSSTGTSMNYGQNASGITVRQPASFKATSTSAAQTSAQPFITTTQASVTYGNAGSNTNTVNSSSSAVSATATGNLGTQLADLYKQYAQAKDHTDKLQTLSDDYQKQADENAVKLPDMAQKVRFGLAKQDEYDALVNHVKALRSQADSSRGLAENFQVDRDNYKKGMDQLIEAQKGGGLFDSAEECARHFAETAMPMTDQTNKEYSAVMTTVQVPVYENGKWTTKPKYKYGDIVEGEHGKVINNAIAGLLAKTDGEKYLLHTHPNSIYSNYNNSGQTYVDQPDLFSGLPFLVDPFNPNIPPNKESFGDVSVPTILGNLGLPLLSKIAGVNLKGYDGIYLASPTGKLFLYQGLGDDNYHAYTYEGLQNKKNLMVSDNFLQSKVQWDSTTNTYKPGYWVHDNKDNSDKFILTP